MAKDEQSCLIIGAGAGLGASLARAFASEGLTVCLTRRERHLAAVEELAASINQAGGNAHGFGVDARDEQAMSELFARIETEIAPLDVVIFNIGANVYFPVAETTARVYSKVWEMASFAGFLAGREAARIMVPRARGTILFTGASASLRGRAGFSAFAGAKHALRALAQSMARELAPQGIHVAHIIVDGVIDGTFARQNIADYEGKLSRDEILSPDEIAKNYVWLWRQHRSAWSHEIDLRPYSEQW